MNKTKKIQRAIKDILIISSSICGAGMVIESELAALINKTKTTLEDVMKPSVADGLSKNQLKDLAKGQRQFHNIANTPSLAEQLTVEQKNEIDRILKDYSNFDFSKYVNVEEIADPSAILIIDPPKKAKAGK